MNVSSSQAYTISGVDSMTDDLSSPLHLPPLEDKAILVDFDGGRLSSDGGLILLGDPDEQIGLTRALAAVLRDPRDARRVDFTTHDLLKQRVFQIAVGYEDANDANTLRHDPIFKLLLGCLPESAAPLASQPTISRFENRVSRTELYRGDEHETCKNPVGGANTPELVTLMSFSHFDFCISFGAAFQRFTRALAASDG